MNFFIRRVRGTIEVAAADYINALRRTHSNKNDDCHKGWQPLEASDFAEARCIAEIKLPVPVPPPRKHILYAQGDVDAPASIKDINGDVVLAKCRLCFRAEIELNEPCVSPMEQHRDALGSVLSGCAVRAEIQKEEAQKIVEVDVAKTAAPEPTMSRKQAVAFNDEELEAMRAFATPEMAMVVGDAPMRFLATIDLLKDHNQQLEDKLADIYASGDIQQGDILYRKKRVIIGPGITQDEIDLNVARLEIIALNDEKKALQAEIKSMHDVYDGVLLR